MNGRKLRWLNIKTNIVENVQQVYQDKVRKVKNYQKIFMFKNKPEYIRNDNGVEFSSKAMRNFLSDLEMKQKQKY